MIASRKQSKEIEKVLNTNERYSARTDNFLESYGHLLIFITKLSDSDMVHELYHCVDMIFQRIEETYIPVSETRAYLMAHLFDEYKKIKKFL